MWNLALNRISEWRGGGFNLRPSGYETCSFRPTGLGGLVEFDRFLYLPGKMGRHRRRPGKPPLTVKSESVGFRWYRTRTSSDLPGDFFRALGRRCRKPTGVPPARIEELFEYRSERDLFVSTQGPQEVSPHRSGMHWPCLRLQLTPVVCDSHLDATSGLVTYDQTSFLHPSQMMRQATAVIAHRQRELVLP